LVGDNLIKIVASFSPSVVIVCINCDDQTRFEFKCVRSKQAQILACACDGEFDATLLF
jgi:hypothetical protein